MAVDVLNYNFVGRLCTKVKPTPKLRILVSWYKYTPFFFKD